MKIAIYGAGAIGGYLGWKLAAAREATGVAPALIARGAHLAALRRDGLTLVEGGERRGTLPVTASDDPAALGVQDVVVITLKAHSVPAVVPAMQPLLGPETVVVTAVNGVPWWYFYKLAGPWTDRRLAAVDPGDVQWDGIGPARVVGCVVYPAAEVAEPGVIRHVEGNRLSLGEPAGGRSDRAETLSRVFETSGLKAPVRPKIRDELWLKLWGNCAFNPISMLTHATLEGICADPGTRALARAMMVEAQAIAEALGVRFPIDVDRRIDAAGAVGAHKTSMLQDLEAGRPMELDALVGAVAEMGRLVGRPTPTIDGVLALARLRADKAV